MKTNTLHTKVLHHANQRTSSKNSHFTPVMILKMHKWIKVIDGKMIRSVK